MVTLRESNGLAMTGERVTEGPDGVPPTVIGVTPDPAAVFRTSKITLSMLSAWKTVSDLSDAETGSPSSLTVSCLDLGPCDDVTSGKW